MKLPAKQGRSSHLRPNRGIAFAEGIVSFPEEWDHPHLRSIITDCSFGCQIGKSGLLSAAELAGRAQPFEILEQYFKKLKAPCKEIVWFEKSGHMPNLEEPEVFQDRMISVVLENSDV